MDKNKLVELGVVNKPHGIRGASLLKLHNSDSSVLKKGTKVWVFPNSKDSTIATTGEQFTIGSINFATKTICSFSEIRDRTHLEELIPFNVMYPRDLFPDLDEDEFYLNDLVGLSLIDESGKIVGEVLGEYDNGVQTVLTIKVNGEELDLPLVKNFFPEIDFENKKIHINLPEYL